MALFLQTSHLVERPVAQALCLNGRKEEKTISADLSHQIIYRAKILGCGYIICPADGIRVTPESSIPCSEDQCINDGLLMVGRLRDEILRATGRLWLADTIPLH
jgi:hypothetical protein